jgi:hypothetical protein
MFGWGGHTYGKVRIFFRKIYFIMSEVDEYGDDYIFLSNLILKNK